jgi:hypothetical protein
MKTLTMIAAAVLLCSATAARAESSRRSTSTLSSTSSPKLLLGVDGSFGMPIGNYADVNGVGGGVLLSAEYPLIESVSATARIGFNYQLDKTVGTADVHVHSIPILFGAKYYVMPERQGLFAAAEVGMFDLMFGASSGGVSASDNQLKFGGGVGLGWQMKQWNARVNLHSHDFGNIGDAMLVSAGVGYQFAGF